VIEWSKCLYNNTVFLMLMCKSSNTSKYLLIKRSRKSLHNASIKQIVNHPRDVIQKFELGEEYWTQVKRLPIFLPASTAEFALHSLYQCVPAREPRKSSEIFLQTIRFRFWFCIFHFKNIHIKEIVQIFNKLFYKVQSIKMI
jgi:hypothetical protein